MGATLSPTGAHAFRGFRFCFHYHILPLNRRGSPLTKGCKKMNKDKITYNNEDNFIYYDGLLSQKAAAKYLGTTIGTLNSWRHYGKQKIPFVRWGNRIRYRKEDLDAWIRANVENAIYGEQKA